MSTVAPQAWLQRVSDYQSGGVSAEERAAVEAHLAECAECRLALAAYRRLYTLARSPLRLSDGGAGALAEYRPMILEETMLTTDPDTRNIATRPPRRTALTALGAIAAVLLIAILTTTLFAHFRSPTQPVSPRPTPTPALDAQSQAYITLLRTYYLPFADADDVAANCWWQVKATAIADREHVLATCRSPEAAELALAQTLHTQLAAAAPPARWQAPHSALQQAVDGMIALLTGLVAAIDAQDVSRYVDAQGLSGAANLFCAPIVQLNAGPPPLSPKLYTPNSSTC
jgi:hypothetical protein